MSQMCPNCSFDNPDDAPKCSNCPATLQGLLGYRTTLGSRYQVISVLGCGAMGAVYLAEDKRLVGRRCAIKENRPDANASPEFQAQTREQFLAEANVLGQLDHPGLPKVSDYFIENERQYLVMDYVEGEDLDSALQRARQPMSEELVLFWADQVLDALAYLHSQSPQPIIHRDIKPANIRVNPLNNKVKLVDFGLVKLLDPTNPKTKAELRGIGTPAYAPLEQFASSDDHTDARSDIYALGASMYHLLTNLYPPDVHKRVLNLEQLTPPRQLNPLLSENTERVVLQAMEIYPGQRFQSAEEMRLALRSPAKSTPAVPPAKPAARKTPAPISAWVFGLVGLMVVLLILAGVSYLLFGLGGNTPAIAQPALSTVEQPTPTPTELFVQALGDAPTDTPTPVVEATPTVETAPVETDTPTPEATATASPVPTNKPTAPVQSVLEASLVGTIAYPVYNGTDFDIYFGQADGSGTRLYRKGASQPAFSPDGTRIAFHSWRLDSWGLMTMDVSGANPIIVANFVEDQLPTWSADGREIVLLSRREGDRKSRLIRVGSTQDRTEGIVISEGEYPTIGLDGRLVFRGWGRTAPGLRSATTSATDLQVLTTSERDTAPAPSPDGQKIAFMSQQEGNWDIYLVSANGSDLQRLTDDPAEDGLPAWSPDGKALAFVSRRGGEWGIWVMSPTGGSQRLLFEMEGSPDGFVGRDTNASRGWTEERISWTR
ncbi:MAG: protein kinase [Anaerolineae bacterium]|nr:protein kinase [Anaerolineae bacterium]